MQCHKYQEIYSIGKDADAGAVVHAASNKDSARKRGFQRKRAQEMVQHEKMSASLEF